MALPDLYLVEEQLTIFNVFAPVAGSATKQGEQM